jgi:hypothetical protein
MAYGLRPRTLPRRIQDSSHYWLRTTSYAGDGRAEGAHFDDAEQCPRTGWLASRRSGERKRKMGDNMENRQDIARPAVQDNIASTFGRRSPT